ncbi:hypothetical protein N0V88_007541 [Collariella sp. IMI 366227]|nr:hypothetical protein N0V88_007541 [Collariella sp. IMI 366227]
MAVEWDLVNPAIQNELQNKLILELTQVGIWHDPRATRDMVPDEVWKEMTRDPEIEGLIRKKEQLKRVFSGKEKRVVPFSLPLTNARLITGNVITEMASPDEMPYCVWLGVYVLLLATALYLELDLLPDVSIAEEARESGNDGSTAIFEHIMGQPTRYAVMDDYRCTTSPLKLIEPIEWDCIELAKTARRVMVNDLSTLPADPEDYGGGWYCLHEDDDQGSYSPCFPRVIFHPLFPQPATLMELIRRWPNNPCIRLAVALASIAADYYWIYDTISPAPSEREDGKDKTKEGMEEENKEEKGTKRCKVVRQSTK